MDRGNLCAQCGHQCVLEMTAFGVACHVCPILHIQINSILLPPYSVDKQSPPRVDAIRRM